MKHYRYTSGFNGEILLHTFETLAETKKCYWVIEPYFYNVGYSEEFIKKHRRLVSKSSRKRFCYPTLNEAWVSFKARKRRHIQHLKHQLEAAECALELAMKQDSAPEKDFPSMLIFLDVLRDTMLQLPHRNRRQNHDY